MLIQAELLPRAQLEDHTAPRYRYGARSESAVYVADLLCEEVPALREPDGGIEIVAIARRPGVLSKIAVRRRPDLAARSSAPSATDPDVAAPTSIGADHLARVREHLDGERIDVVAWTASAPEYITAALGLAEVPPMVLLAGLRHARVLLGEIDVRGISGWRGLNSALASALTGWRVRLQPIATTDAWRRLESALREGRPVPAVAIDSQRLDVLGLYARLVRPEREPRAGQELEVRVFRMDPDEGRIFASDRLARRQLALPLS